MNLTVEGLPDNPAATADDVRRAAAALATGRGPTFVVLSTADGSFAQAAGVDGRFVIEVRDVFGGEGWRHWRAYRVGGGDGQAIVTYHQRCPQGKHLLRGCPLQAVESDVLGGADVAAALQQFAQDGSRQAGSRGGTSRANSCRTPTTMATSGPSDRGIPTGRDVAAHEPVRLLANLLANDRFSTFQRLRS